jgi:hypothetical protein
MDIDEEEAVRLSFVAQQQRSRIRQLTLSQCRRSAARRKRMTRRTTKKKKKNEKRWCAATLGGGLNC